MSSPWIMSTQTCTVSFFEHSGSPQSWPWMQNGSLEYHFAASNSHSQHRATAMRYLCST
ncbi:hypothetical protein RHMOL_Rhmol06G0034700 [Rhododendron molle]|uniref:Uncharacterized protein n=1 Tax=Rhododendron molle TaxID=49168 RepID=A0ACC0N9T4_RHOML|nr:hypothetical protein RHMOL_Rhmol06G0034700 [Rhododendron molle]